MSVLRALWNLLGPRQRRHLVGLQLLSIVMALSTVGGVAAVLPFFAVLSDPDGVAHSAVARTLLQHWRLDEVSFVIVLGMAFAAAVLMANAVNLFGLLAINRFAVRVGDALYTRLFAEYLHRSYEFHAHSSGSVLASRVQESARVTSGIVQQALILVTNLVTIAFVVIAVVLVNPIVAVGAMAGLGACYAAIYAAARKRLARNGQFETRYHIERMRTVNEAFGAIKEVVLLRAQSFFVDRFVQQSRAISRAATSTLAITQSPKYVLECLTVICLVAVALYLRNHSGTTGSWMAQLSFVAFAAYRLLPALQQVFAAIVKIRADRAAFAGVELDLRDAPGALESTRNIASDPACHRRPSREIRVCDVSFRYSPERPPAVRDVSLVIPAGAIVGFMGSNGSGKTTLLDLVCGLLVPQSGHIEVDGIRLDGSNSQDWQATIAYVPQHVFLLEGTLAENVAFGVPPARIDRQRLEAAVRAACLTECVASLPGGYEERLGPGGRGLSGGQRQRLAIARALYRDASLLILDEATSALDASSESEITQLLESLRSDRTILVIAHRAGALRHCDLVVELAAGKIVGIQQRGQPVPVKTRAVGSL